MGVLTAKLDERVRGLQAAGAGASGQQRDQDGRDGKGVTSHCGGAGEEVGGGSGGWTTQPKI